MIAVFEYGAPLSSAEITHSRRLLAARKRFEGTLNNLQWLLMIAIWGMFVWVGVVTETLLLVVGLAVVGLPLLAYWLRSVYQAWRDRAELELVPVVIEGRLTLRQEGDVKIPYWQYYVGAVRVLPPMHWEKSLAREQEGLRCRAAMPRNTSLPWPLLETSSGLSVDFEVSQGLHASYPIPMWAGLGLVAGGLPAFAISIVALSHELETFYVWALIASFITLFLSMGVMARDYYFARAFSRRAHEVYAKKGVPFAV